ncbi:MAG: hypothetical protein ACYTFV_03715 [Planctomycetota bacterium]
MTDEQAQALGARAMACKGYRWMPGMTDGTAGARCVRSRGGSCVWAVDDWLSDWCDLGEGEWPDFRDPATLGCLLALVREAWGDPDLGVRRRTKGAWQVLRRGGAPSVCEGASEAEALVVALEAAP